MPSALSIAIFMMMLACGFEAGRWCAWVESVIGEPAPQMIYDAVHGWIRLPAKFATIVATREFQALKRVYQLGNVHHVYAGARHTRYDHSIGAFYLGGLAMHHLRAAQPELEIDDTLIETVQLALLAHDWGHTAFSHLTDHHLKSVGSITHEQRSVKLLQHMMTSDPSRTIYVLFDRQQVDLACALIVRDTAIDSRTWLFDLVSSPRMDMDRLDYLARDTRFVGVRPDLWPHSRSFIATLWVNRTTHSLQYGSAAELRALLQLRERMYTAVYRHPHVVAIDHEVSAILDVVAQHGRWPELFQHPLHLWRTAIGDSNVHDIRVLVQAHPDCLKVREAYQSYLRVYSGRVPWNDSLPTAELEALFGTVHTYPSSTG